MTPARRVAMAIACHPDDIEFMMAGTLLLLQRAGYEIHYMNIANGALGTDRHSREEIIAIRETEAKSACQLVGAVFHPSVTDDLDVFYNQRIAARVLTEVRRANPGLVLVPAPDDYFEDHTEAARVAVTAVFCRGIPNYPMTEAEAVDSEVTIYHALPYGLRDPLRRRIMPEYYVDIASVLTRKREMLAQHRSQKEWLDVSQGVNAYLSTMEQMSAEVGRMSGRFSYAEGWRRRNHLGYCSEEAHPLGEALGDLVLVNDDYRRKLEEPFPGDL